MGVGASKQSVQFAGSTSHTLYEFFTWLEENFHVSDYIRSKVDSYLGDRVKVIVSNAIYDYYWEGFLKEEIWSFSTCSQNMPGSAFKHHFIYARSSNFYLTAEYFKSSNVHMRISESEWKVLSGRQDIKVKENFSLVIARDVEWFLISIMHFVDADYSFLSHNCKDFVKHMVRWLHY